MRSEQAILDDIGFFELSLQDAEKYQDAIFDVVSTVGQVHMLEHNREYIAAIKLKIDQLKTELKESEKYYAE